MCLATFSLFSGMIVPSSTPPLSSRESNFSFSRFFVGLSLSLILRGTQQRGLADLCRVSARDHGRTPAISPQGRRWHIAHAVGTTASGQRLGTGRDRRSKEGGGCRVGTCRRAHAQTSVAMSTSRAARSARSAGNMITQTQAFKSVLKRIFCLGIDHVVRAGVRRHAADMTRRSGTALLCLGCNRTKEQQDARG